MITFNGKKILIVEDDSFLLGLLSKKLVDRQASVLVASDGEEAINLVKSNPKFDLILLDIMLPKIGGFEVMEAINADEKTKGTPIMILSNLGEKADIERGLSLGAKKFLVKAILSLDEIIEAAYDIVSENR